MNNEFDGESVLVTGGTGSFGRAFTKFVLKNHNPRRLIIFSRDEMKQWEMAKQYSGDSRVRFFIGDVRDASRVNRALDGVDRVVHAAATKIVEASEYNPFECIKTNVYGGQNLIDACIDQGVKSCVALSTDKACKPVNLYGSSKLASDKLFIAANSSYSRQNRCMFSVVRYGNVMGSRGSIIPYFASLRNAGVFPITDLRMTRFMITLQEAVESVIHAFNNMKGGEIYVKKIPSMKIIDIANAMHPSAQIEIIGIRPGEKLHEEMISLEDAQNTFEYPDYYKILPPIHSWASDPERIEDGVRVSENFSYRSDSNKVWMTKTELSAWFHANKRLIEW